MKKPKKEELTTKLDDMTEDRMAELSRYYRKVGEAVLEITPEELDDLKKRSERFRIDHGRLSEEVAIQPEVYNHVANYHAHAVRRLRMKEMEEENAKFKLKIAKSHARIRIKRMEEKATVADLDARIEIDASVLAALQEYQNAQYAVIEAEKVVHSLEADKESAYQKGHMLNLLKSNLERETKMKSW